MQTQTTQTGISPVILAQDPMQPKARPYNREEADKLISYLTGWYKIKVQSYSTTSCGWADWDSREIKVPTPTNIDRFGVYLHEIKHIIDGNKGRRFEQEFACDKFALDHIEKLGFDSTEWKKRMRWHCLSRIAMATNRGLSPSKIPSNIWEYFSDINFNEWAGRRVFVSSDRKFSKIEISII